MIKDRRNVDRRNSKAPACGRRSGGTYDDRRGNDALRSLLDKLAPEYRIDAMAIARLSAFDKKLEVIECPR